MALKTHQRLLASVFTLVTWTQLSAGLDLTECNAISSTSYVDSGCFLPLAIDRTWSDAFADCISRGNTAGHNGRLAILASWTQFTTLASGCADCFVAARAPTKASQSVYDENEWYWHPTDAATQGPTMGSGYQPPLNKFNEVKNVNTPGDGPACLMTKTSGGGEYHDGKCSDAKKYICEFYSDPVAAATTTDACPTGPTTPTNGMCPLGYQLLSTVEPPVMYVMQTCIYYEPACCVDQCYWANQRDTGPYIFGTFANGDCGSNFFGTSDQYNIGIGTIWREGTKAVYIAGWNISTTKDQKYCCVSNKHKVTVGSCGGGSANAGGYKYDSGGTGDIPAGPLDISTLGKVNPIVRQFDDSYKHAYPNYDYRVYVCGTEVDPASTCGCGSCDVEKTTTTTASPFSTADAAITAAATTVIDSTTTSTRIIPTTSSTSSSTSSSTTYTSTSTSSSTSSTRSTTSTSSTLFPSTATSITTSPFPSTSMTTSTTATSTTPNPTTTSAVGPIDCVYTWDMWDECSVTCGGGAQNRTISITTNDANGGSPCPASPETQACNTAACPVDCVVSQWSNWTECSATCGRDLVKLRTRNKDVEPLNGGTECPSLREEINCGLKKCIPLTAAEKVAVAVVQTLGCIWILGALGLTMGAFILLRIFSLERMIHFCEELSLFIAHLLVLFLRDRTELGVPCKWASIFLQYFFTVHFTFMPLEAIQAYCMITNVISMGGFFNIPVNLMIGWGLPAAITGLTATIHHDNYVSDFSCWLNLGHSVVLGTILPIGIASILSIIIVEAAGLGDFSPLPSTDKAKVLSAQLNRQGILIKLPLSLGSWFFGLFAVYFQRFALYGLVFGLNIAIGSVIFVFHSLNNKEVGSHS